MIGYPGAPRAWWYTRAMARLGGVNLARAVLDGWLPRSDLHALVARCAACDRVEECRLWLGRTDRPPSMPEFCPNRSAIAALAD
jgi:Family of unknown function (DUF6455)